MYNGKLVSLYQSLQTDERKALRKWVNSPAHNSHVEVSKLFEYLFSRRRLSKVSCNKKRVFEYLYPKQAFDNTRLHHTASLGVKLLEDFISFWRSKKNAFPKYKKLVLHCKARNLEKLANYYFEQQNKAQQHPLLQNSLHFHDQYELEQLRFELEGTGKRIRETNIQAIFDNLSVYFIIETLRYACLAGSHTNLYKTNYNIHFLEAILVQASQPPYTDIPAVQFYYYGYLALTQPEKAEHFVQLKQLLIQHGTILPAQELQNLYVIAINYCVKRLNTGAEEYVQEVFEIYKQGLKVGALLENGRLSRFAYKNIAIAALRLGEYDWVADYIPRYAPYVDPKYRENYVHYNTAKLHFARGDYGQTLQLLTQVEYDDLFMSIGAKIMLLKIYYEQGEHDPLEALLNSFQVFLQRKKMMSYHKENYQNIIRFTRKLFQVSPYDKAAQKKLRQEIQEANPLTERGWLLGQLGGDDLKI